MNEELQHPQDRLREFIRKHKHGGCRIFSEGAACLCPLCDLDRLIELLDHYRKEQKGEI